MSTETFYADLPAGADFAAFSDRAGYTPLPDDWTLLATDVVSSTQAIRDGKYKQVNMAGAATIMAALNAADGLDCPYVFGGDGAFIAVPEPAAAAAAQALARTTTLARDVYGLELRAAAFPLQALRARSGDVTVRKLSLGKGARLALFDGPGLGVADALLKDDTAGAPFRIPPDDAPPDLEGLSCRWEPLAAANGLMLTLIAAGRGDDPAGALARVRRRIQAVLGGDETAAAPASDATLKFRWLPRGLKLEALARAGRKAFWQTYLPLLLETIAQGYAERFGKRVGPYNAPSYRQEMKAQTDFRRFDGMLRLVLDLTPSQADAIEAMLADERAAGHVVYGLHRADAALMTCLVFDLAHADHIHFIDGADGGFALAAKQMKAQVEGLDAASM